MKKNAFLIISCALFINASAASAKILKIGYINFETAFAQEHEAQKYVRDLEAQEAALSAEEQKEGAILEAKANKFKASAPKLSEQARNAEEAKLSGEINEWRQKYGDKRSKLSTERSDKVADLEKKNKLKAESLGRKGGYDFVLNSAAVVYASDENKKHDLTQELIKEYNKDYPVKPAPAKPAPASPVKK